MPETLPCMYLCGPRRSIWLRLVVVRRASVWPMMSIVLRWDWKMRLCVPTYVHQTAL